MEQAVGIDFAILPQWLRLSFHDAGTFNQMVPEGGANGCLMNHPPMRTMNENLNLDLALNTLAAVQSLWEGNAGTCLSVSAADMIQFAGWFSVIRQKDVPGLTAAKRTELVQRTHWGRPDEKQCQTAWTANLPGFSLGLADPEDIPGRCKFAGGEIKNKMMDRNGFTDMEATALMGAHTIGLTRNVFGTGGSLVSQWAHNGHDSATPQGAVFDNAFHQYLEFDVVANNVFDFANNIAAFDVTFPDWFRETATKIGHLDTDMALAFPSIDTSIHPHFDMFTKLYANDNALFMEHFMAVFTKMSALGVTVPLVIALDCQEGCAASSSGNSTTTTTTTIGPQPQPQPAAVVEPVLTVQDKRQVDQDVVDAVLEATAQLVDTEIQRADEIANLTMPVLVNDIRY
jgi:Peroxidase